AAENAAWSACSERGSWKFRSDTCEDLDADVRGGPCCPCNQDVVPHPVKPRTAATNSRSNEGTLVNKAAARWQNWVFIMISVFVFVCRTKPIFCLRRARPPFLVNPTKIRGWRSQAVHLMRGL